MDTQIGVSRFIILIPHKDALIPFNSFRQSLFSHGFSGAFSFPACAPLAEVKKSFRREELRILGKQIRELSWENDGKFRSLTMKKMSGTRFALIGLELNLKTNEVNFGERTKEKIISVMEPVLCAAIVKQDEIMHETLQPPEISFRSASLANLIIRPITKSCSSKKTSSYSYEWKISSSVWLPAWRRYSSMDKTRLRDE